jgi:3',5'-cyclic AMP phosphodiesterase CpdA
MGPVSCRCNSPGTTALKVNTSETDPILVGAGDIAACGISLPVFNMATNGEATARILDALFANGANPNGVVFTAGDNAYYDGSPEDFAKCYNPSWGRHKARTRPAAGNHDYETPGAAGYFAYFGSRTGGDPKKGAYYSYELGAWHIIVIDSNIPAAAGSPQEQWLRADLAQHPTKCALAYWHHPRFSSAKHGSLDRTKDIWQALYEGGVEIVMNGHDHVYERFGPQDPAGRADPMRGIRQFTVGTGGGALYGFKTPLANSEVRYRGGHGVLKLTLHPDRYDWEFISEAGKAFSDSGTADCH